MANEWRIATVEELEIESTILVQDGNHGEYRPRSDEFCIGGTAFIRAADIDDARVRFESASCINQVALARIRKGIGAPGDVLFSHKGTVGKLALVQADAPAFVCSPQTTFWRTLAPNVLDRRYLYYFMQCAEFREQWAARKGETDMADYVSLTAQRAFRLALPPIDEQRAIAQVLGALDDKIELNRQTNHTLEQLASARFKSWFIDFDPVVSKADGRKPFGMDATTAALFPAAFEDSALGVIPRGWRATTWGRHVTLSYGKALANYANASGPVRVYGTNGPIGWTSGALCEDPTIVVGRKGAYRGVHFESFPSWTIDTAFYLQPSATVDIRWAYYSLVRRDINAIDSGSAIPSTSRDDFYSLGVVLPPMPLQDKFREACDEWWQLQTALHAETETLAALRDILLPNLLSGEVRLKQAAQAVEAAL